MGNTDYDVVIVGGRIAGAALATRLGKRGHRVLLLDKATFPSAPGVPSSPIIYSIVPPMLEELGLTENAWADAVVPSTTFSFEFGDHFQAVIEAPEMWGRRGVFGLDRARFDTLLWQLAEREPTVETRQDFAVTDLLREDGRVVGVVGEQGGEQIRARCVVGADGRFSLVARKAGAKVVEEESTHLSTVYYATWEGVAPLHEGLDGAVQVFTTGRGLDLLCVPQPGRRMLVNTHERADRVETGGDAMGYYMDRLRRHVRFDHWLGGAERVSELVGMKRIGNGYREASGPGWALVGDALHYKDPVDGQGIHDALLGAKILDEALSAWLEGDTDWDAAVADYRDRFWVETHPMFLETVGRLRRELFSEPPVPVIKTLIRWSMTDPVYQERFLNYLGRTIPPTGWASPRLMLGVAMRGLRDDLLGRRRASLPMPSST